ncbi:MAG TPA: hypothetical protein DIW47_03755 [Bacteroidetes bacterium]|nr:hypothetical protein [Bacteroidota bacterium]
MDQDKSTSLLIRQLRDIQSHADKIVNGDSSSSNIETFSRYSIELVAYVKEKIDTPEILKFIVEIPTINYKKTEIKFWQFLILPLWWLILYKDYQIRNQAVQEIRHSRGKFATLEVMMNDLKGV